MQYNVSQLLQSVVGSRRQYPVDGSIRWVADGRSPIPATGEVELVRTNDGILVRALVRVVTEDECSRCLEPAKIPIDLRIEEEFFPTVDVITGVLLPPPREVDAFTIDHNHILDLEPAIREYAVAMQPMQPLCREDCRGICPECGADLNKSNCGHAGRNVDSRWAALGRLAKQE